MARTRAVIHLGPIKSGTTALARYLTTASARGLLPPGLVYPSGDLWLQRSGGILRQRDDFDVVTGPDGTPKFRNPEVPQALSSLAAHLTDIEGPLATALFIVETASARLDPSFLVTELSPHFDEVLLISMARRQDRALASIIAQRAKMWGAPTSLDPRDHVGIGDPDIAALDYHAMLQRWGSGGVRHRLLPYLEGEQGTYDTIARVFTALGLGEPSVAKGIEGRRIHPTFSAEGMRQLAEIKSRSEHAWFPGSRARLRERFEATLATYHASAIDGGVEPSGRRFAPWTLSDQDASWVLRLFAESNKRMLREVDRSGFDADWKRWSSALEETR